MTRLLAVATATAPYAAARWPCTGERSVRRSVGRAGEPLEERAEPEPAIGLACTLGGRYQLLRVIGSGGMGIVFEARDAALGRSVAVKLSRTSGTGGRRDQTRLRREARVMAALRHPGLVTLHDLGDFEGQVFLVMELVRGATLREHIGGSACWRARLPLLIAAGRGLAAVHAAGFVHRDIKPENLLVGEDGRVVITDFGLATSQAAEEPLDVAPPAAAAVPPASTLDSASASSLGGTQGYLAPERVAGGAGDGRADLFALCVTAYELLEGHHPFRFHGHGALSQSSHYLKLRAPCRPWRRWNVPARLHAAIERGLAADPAERWPSADEFVGELEACLTLPDE